MLPFLSKKPKFIPSPNFNERRDGKAPKYIVLHYTDTLSTEEALDKYLCNPEAEVSAHYVIEKNGNILQLVEEDKRAWHAGVSEWQGETDMNSASIGIELVNPGHTYGLAPFPEPQIESLVALCKDIMARQGVSPENIIGHEDIAPGRKVDPGPLFPWEMLVAQGVAVRNLQKS